MSKWLAIARGEQDISEILPDTQHKPSKSPPNEPDTPFKMVYDGCRQENSDENSERANEVNDRAETSVPKGFKHGLSIGGRPMTWTGKVVSLEDWRQLSEWEKHGPNGRVWNGKTQRWELPHS